VSAEPRALGIFIAVPKFMSSFRPLRPGAPEQRPVARRRPGPSRGIGAAHPWWIVAWLAVPPTLWLVARSLDLVDVESPFTRRACRNLGYVGFLALLIPYLYIWRRSALHRSRGNMTRWMRWHVASAYFAFGLMFIHAHGPMFRVGLTAAIVALFSTAILSALLGLLLQRVVFRLMALTLDLELGPERLFIERRRMIEMAAARVKNYSLLAEGDVADWRAFCKALRDDATRLPQRIWKRLPQPTKALIEATLHSRDGSPSRKDVVVAALNDLLKEQTLCTKHDFGVLTPQDEAYPLVQQRAQELSMLELERRNRLFLERLCPELIKTSQKPPQTVERFFEIEVARYLATEFPSWGWLFRAEALEPVSRNHYLRVRTLVSEDQLATVDQLWQWVQKRRRMDLEFWFHRLARIWLVVHIPVAWALVALVIFHVASSIYYGGWL
jgi:hypothetical protein